MPYQLPKIFSITPRNISIVLIPVFLYVVFFIIYREEFFLSFFENPDPSFDAIEPETNPADPAIVPRVSKKCTFLKNLFLHPDTHQISSGEIGLFVLVVTISVYTEDSTWVKEFIRICFKNT